MARGQLLKRIIALSVALAIVAPISVVAARWQWNRHIERETRNNLITLNVQRPAADIASVVTASVTAQQEWMSVSARGRFDPNKQKLWRKQPLNGEPGFIVITPFELITGQELLVARGWVAADGRNPTSSTSLKIDAAEQTITVRIRLLPESSEPDPTDLPSGQTNSPRTMMSPQTIIGLFELRDAASPQTLTPIPLPQLEAGPHLGYVGQWIIICISAFVVYITVMRRLRIDYQANATKSE